MLMLMLAIDFITMINKAKVKQINYMGHSLIVRKACVGGRGGGAKHFG